MKFIVLLVSVLMIRIMTHKVKQPKTYQPECQYIEFDVVLNNKSSKFKTCETPHNCFM
jgi:hypothetical protein